MPTRREFLLTSAAAAAPQGNAQPWYRRTYRWGQTNITEKDAIRYDIPWWRDYWKRTQVQGVIVNAAGIVAYYPSKYPLQYRAQFLSGRDLFGEVAKAAHEDGLVVLARMDSNRVTEEFYKAHPDWITRNAAGEPYRAAERYVTCINSGYYEQWIPDIMREIIERSHPEGFTDNSWAGLGRESICYCRNCERRFGQALPRRKDWTDPVYRRWIQWNYERRLEIWDINNRTTRAAGGPDCIWVGMNSGSVTSESNTFRDLREISKRAPFMLLDHQRRDDNGTFEQNGDTGKLVHGVLGWDKLAPESMAMYQAGRTSFRLSAKPAVEARMWMIEGFAGGIQPWWHHVGAFQEDRRAFQTAEPVMRWYRANQEFMVNREPVASVGVVWTQRNTDYYGREQASVLVDQPYRGFTHALVRARIPYLPVHADDIDKGSFALLVLPSVAALSDAQCAAIRRFVQRGGSLIATGASSLYNEWGDPRPDFALADLFRAHAPQNWQERAWAGAGSHTYLRLPAQRGAVLEGFGDTDILPFGGKLAPMRVDPGAEVALTFVPEFPIYPPEFAWMREPKTDIPGLILSTHGNARVAYMPADIDRRYVRENLPDHARLLANLVRWAVGGAIPLEVKGPGLVDCHLYRQGDRRIMHLVNLTSTGTWRAPIDELISLGPFEVRVRAPGRTVRLLVAGSPAPASSSNGWMTFPVNSIADHEVAVIG